MDIFFNRPSFAFGDSIYPNGGYYGPLHRRYMGMLLMHQGKGLVRVDDQTFEINSGQVAFIYSEYLYKISFPQGQKSFCTWCGTDSDELVITEDKLPQIKSMPFLLSPSDDLRMLLSVGLNAEHGGGVRLKQKRNSLGEAVFNELFYLAGVEAEERPLPKAIIMAKRYINKNYAKKMDLTTLAKKVSVSPQHLIKLFKQHLDTTPMNYLWHIRSEKAVHLICYSGLIISNISSQCGFKDPYHFSRYIKKHYGYSPTELRKRKWGNDSEENEDILDYVSY